MNHLERLAAAQSAHFAQRRGSLPERGDGVRAFPVQAWGPPVLIAEFKRSSPSHGAFDAPDLAEQLRRYEEIGAAAVSVLVAGEGFGGDPSDLAKARRLTHLPLLYKGFVSCLGQVDEAYAYGADAVLLIAALLKEEMGAFLARAEQLGLAALCEVHDAAEMRAAAALGAGLIGVNNRDLRTLEVDTRRFLSIAPQAPKEVLLVAESGYRSRASVREAAAAGARGLLIGEALLSGSELCGPWGEVLLDVG